MVDNMSKRPTDNTLPDEEDERRIEPDIYNGIARCAELLGIQLIESNFSVAPAFFEFAEEGKLSLDVSDLHEAFDEENRVSSCIFQFESSKKKGKKKLFSIKDKYVVFYRINSDCDEFHALAFARRTGVMACYPYFRAHVAATASLANAHMPILPTLAKMPIKTPSTEKEGRK